MERAEEIAIHYLEVVFGFQVFSIETTDERRADLRAHDGVHGYTIEVKDKLDTGNHSTFSEVHLPKGGSVFVRSDPHKRSNRMENILRNGSKQIAKTPDSDQTFNLIWLNFEGPNADIMGRQLLYSFYGVADLHSRDSKIGSKSCVYFDYSASIKMPNIHALVLCENHSLSLAINEFAENIDKFRVSSLVKRFGNSKIDPCDFDADKSKIVLRSSISRKNEQEVLEEVKRQTGLEYYRVVLSRYSFGPGSQDTVS